MPSTGAGGITAVCSAARRPPDRERAFARRRKEEMGTGSVWMTFASRDKRRRKEEEFAVRTMFEAH